MKVYSIPVIILRDWTHTNETLTPHIIAEGLKRKKVPNTWEVFRSHLESDWVNNNPEGAQESLNLV